MSVTDDNSTTQQQDKRADDKAEEFDPERSQRVIAALREDLRKAKEDKEPQSEKDARVIAGMKKQIDELTQRAGDVDVFRTKAQEAEEAAQETALSLHREKAARKFGLNEEQFEFLTELTDPEAIDKRAELVASTLASKPVRPVDPAQGTSSETKAEPEQQFADFIQQQLGRTSANSPS